MSNINRNRRGTATLLTGMLAIGTFTLAPPAAAQDNPTTGTAGGCTYAGSSYSNGSTRQQVKHYSNGTKVYENYECRNGSWVYTGTSRKAGVLPKRTTVQPPVNG